MYRNEPPCEGINRVKERPHEWAFLFPTNVHFHYVYEQLHACGHITLALSVYEILNKQQSD